MDFTFIINLSYQLNKYGKTFKVPITYTRRSISEGKKLVGNAKTNLIKNSLGFIYKNLYNKKTNRADNINKTIDKISVVIPYYNEELVILDTLKKITSIGELILVNNCSSDNGINIVQDFINNYTDKDLEISHLFCSELGKGNALICGFKTVKYDTILMTDADGEFEITEYPKLIQKFKELDNSYVSVVAGYAVWESYPYTIKQTVYSNLFNLLYNSTLGGDRTDSGTRIIHSKIIKELIENNELIETKFAIELNLSHKINKYGKTYELPITFNPRSYKDGKKLINEEIYYWRKDKLLYIFKQLFSKSKVKHNLIIIKTVYIWVL